MAHTVVIGLFFLSFFSCSAAQVYDVTKYGAIGDGKTSSDKALLSAFYDACSSKSSSTVLIPEGKFAVGVVKMTGPCNAPIEIKLQGTLLAPEDPSLFPDLNWLTFSHIDQLKLTGGGVIDGQGKLAWSLPECREKQQCLEIPNLRFNSVTNAWISSITTLNSKNFHILVLQCKNINFDHLTITAPADSPNTDGIHIGRSDGVNVTDTTIATGDDCISLGDGSRDVFATRVQCGPGHGISVGSLGKLMNEKPVVGVTISNCTFLRTQNGIRIKTWPASYPGRVAKVYVKDVRMQQVSNPILIDQYYCPWNKCNPKIPSLVQISDVSFNNIWGSSATAVSVRLSCSSKVPCQNIRFSNINLSNRDGKGPSTSTCENVNPILSSGKLIPRICS